jgi:tetratricopeptide (TPR) repeat protein
MSADSEDLKRFFIAHSSRQKDFALELREALHKDAWVDLHEIDIGDILLDEIAAGIEGASDFVLLWTHDSASSSWVRYETHMAFVRYLEDAAINIRIVCLDDAPLPLHLRPLLQARDITQPDEIAAVLLGAPPVRRTLRAFVNRNTEIGELERVLYSAERGLIWYYGLAGIGKRALAREAMRRLSADPFRTARVSVQRGTGFVELHLKMSLALHKKAPESALTERAAREQSAELMESFAGSGGIWLFEDAQHWLDVDGAPDGVLSEVLRALSVAGVGLPEHGAIFTSTRRPALEDPYASISEVQRVRGLEPAFAEALLRAAGADGTDALVRAAAAQLAGHPLALELTAGALKSGSPVDWEQYRASTAQALLGELRVDPQTEMLLMALAAVDGPLPGEAFASHLSLPPEAFSRAVSEGSAYSLIEERGGFLWIHPLVRDFYVRAVRRRPDFRDRIDDLATRSRNFFLGASHPPIVYVDSLLTSFRLLSWSGRLGEALELHQTAFGTLLETAIDLYNERRYREALQYIEAVIESTEENRKAKLYKARVLAYLSRGKEARETVDQLLTASPTDVELLRVRGRVEFILREWEGALAFFELARQQRPRSVPVLRDLGQVNIRLERWEAAREALSQAIGVDFPDAYVQSFYSQVLEHFGELNEARSAIEAATSLDPDNAGFHHRLGRIALLQRDRDTAKTEFRRALNLDPGLQESGISLASILADEGEPVAAREVLRKVERMPAVRPELLATISAKVAFAEGDYSSARDLVEKALANAREPESLILALRIELACFERDGVPADRIRARTEPFLLELRAQGVLDAEQTWRGRVDETLGDA